jgi:hypothetical protein
MQPPVLNPESVSPRKNSDLARYALWSGGITVGVPVLWLLLTNTGGNFGLGIGWLGVLPVMLMVPVGTILTICFGVAAVVESRRKNDRLPGDATPATNQARYALLFGGIAVAMTVFGIFLFPALTMGLLVPVAAIVAISFAVSAVVQSSKKNDGQPGPLDMPSPQAGPTGGIGRRIPLAAIAWLGIPIPVRLIISRALSDAPSLGAPPDVGGWNILFGLISCAGIAVAIIAFVRSTKWSVRILLAIPIYLYFSVASSMVTGIAWSLIRGGSH